MDNSYKTPFYTKAAYIFIAIFAFVFTLYIGQRIIVPIVYATILAILLNPVVNFLLRRKVNKILAISVAVVMTIIAVVVVLYIVSSQISMLSDTYPALKLKFNVSSNQIVQWISEKFN